MIVGGGTGCLQEAQIIRSPCTHVCILFSCKRDFVEIDTIGMQFAIDTPTQPISHLRLDSLFWQVMCVCEFLELPTYEKVLHIIHSILKSAGSSGGPSLSPLPLKSVISPTLCISEGCLEIEIRSNMAASSQTGEIEKTNLTHTVQEELGF